jgi:mevalonate kinase
MIEKEYCSKLLLFGEYGVMLGSKALCMPFPKFSGHFSFFDANPTEPQRESNAALRGFVSYLESVDGLSRKFAVGQLISDLQNGLYFSSSIPIGYGVGSSGALCAAFYGRYAVAKEVECDSLKSDLAIVESYFHGQSSGIDPLISYTGKALLVDATNHVTILSSFRICSNSKLQLFLVDTGVKRKSVSLISSFMEYLNDRENADLKEQQLLLTNRCVETFAGEDVGKELESFRDLSLFQCRHFKLLIPESFIDIWTEGIVSQQFYLKLCGAGGGGFLLGITANYPDVRHYFEERGIPTIPVNG